MAWRRYLVYLVIIVIAVGTGLFFMGGEQQPPPSSAIYTAVSPVAPATPWVNTPEIVEDANAGFTVELSDPEAKATAGTTRGSDWPQFNGARRDNISTETGLLKSWPAGGPKLLWSAKGIGAGYSGLSIVKGVVYTLSNKGKSEAVVALDAGTGTKLWVTPFGPATSPSVGPGPRSTPTVDAEAVYGLGANGDLVVVERQTGKIKWQKNILQEYSGSNIAWGICESVLIDGDNLICTPGGARGTIVALNKRTGNLVWACVTPQKEQAGYASALVTEAGGIRQYIQFTAGGTIGVSAAEGKFLWRNDAANNGTANCSSPLVSGDFVFSASNYGKGGALVKLSKNGAGIDAQLIYETKNMKSHHGDMVITKSAIFGSNDPGVLMCLDLETGKTNWQNRSVGKGSLTCADDCLYLRSEGGAVALFEANTSEYRELGQFEQPHRTSSSAWTHPVVSGGRLFLRDQDLLLCYAVKAP